MLKNSISKLLVLLTLIFSVQEAQAIWTVNENFVYNVDLPTACYNEIVTPDDIFWQGSHVSISYTHDIYQPGNPNIVANLRAQGWRYIYYDIYHVDGLLTTHVKRVTKFTNYLTNVTYALDVNDLVGVPKGNTRVILSTRYEHTANNPYELQLYVNKNGQEGCFEPRFDNAGHFLNCHMGFIDCFYWDPCRAELDVTVATDQCFQDPNNPTNCYVFNSSLTPAPSGKVEYEWTVTSGQPDITGNKSSLYLDWPNGHGPFTVTLIVTLEDGCQYTWTQSFAKKPAAQAIEAAANALQLAPNPVSSVRDAEIRYELAHDGPVSIDLYDLQGRKLQTLLTAADASAGPGMVRLSAGLAPGYYLVSMKTADGLSTQKLVVTD